MVCHHMNNIHICHHFGMKFSDGDRYEFFIPSLHTVTFVTVWRLGMKNFHTCHQKTRSDGDGLIGFTIERKVDNGKKRKKRKREKNGENSSPITVLQVDRLTAID